MGISFHKGPVLGNLEGGSSTGDFERWMRGVISMEGFSVKRVSAEGLWGVLLYWGPWKKAQDTGISLHSGNFGKPGRDSLVWNFELQE